MGKARPRTPEGHPHPALAAPDGQAQEGYPLHQPFPPHLDLLLYFVALLIPFSASPAELGA